LWNAIVPLRRRTAPGVVTTKVPGLSVTLEGYQYPHGSALVVTLRFAGEEELLSATGRLVEARQSLQFDATVGDVTMRGTLDEIAECALRFLRSEAIGEAAVEGAPDPTEPFTITTIVRGSGVVPSAPVVQDGDVHRALQALTGWSHEWRENKLRDLDRHALRAQRDAPAGHVMYAASRGRVIWYPAGFARTEKHVHTLGCYHRNLVFLSLQTEALLRLAQLDLGETEAGRPSATRDELARCAVGILGRIYGPGDGGHVESMYQSWSAREQMNDSTSINAVEVLRAQNPGMVPLKRSSEAAGSTPIVKA
jgi:hypothetical protein